MLPCHPRALQVQLAPELLAIPVLHLAHPDLDYRSHHEDQLLQVVLGLQLLPCLQCSPSLPSDLVILVDHPCLADRGFLVCLRTRESHLFPGYPLLQEDLWHLWVHLILTLPHPLLIPVNHLILVDPSVLGHPVLQKVLWGQVVPCLPVFHQPLRDLEAPLCL